MTKLIAETAWHHEGDFLFMQDLIVKLCESNSTDVIKMHITLDLDEYMSRDHDAYDTLKKWLFSVEQWDDLIKIVQTNGKELLLLLNDTSAIKFATQYNPELVELHSVCLNVPRLQQSIIDNIDSKAKAIIGVGGCSLQEIDRAVEAFSLRETILMFGFQNYPTKYSDVNLKKIRKIQSLYSNKKFGYADHTAWDEENNDLITLLVSANGMEYIEKHVTTEYGEKRCDYSAAISIEMFEALSVKVKLLDSIAGDGSISLNDGEQKYAQFGPMKMACIVNRNISCGDVLAENDISFKRTKTITDLSQTCVLSLIGREFRKDIPKGDVLRAEHIK